ncbi:MAG: transglycosylase domain-containing protein [Desulfoarculaceae bacterium]|nr:transglycosylase domain-containing protein [Desulfoarculaceae bacterium]
MCRKIIYFVVFCIVVVLAGLGWAFYWFVILHPGDEINPVNIQRILGKETPVFYSDGQASLGVFFDEAHRQYVTYEQIPQDFVNALVSSEDNNFFSHYGFDPLGIMRAFHKNYQMGRVVQGGSTLTQQTAKNLFKRSGRSYQGKLKELLFALRLEYYYPKEKIFEFYANQFYVSGNGHGLGVAARYFFNKSVDELSLLECAFIAGSVKKPNYYNPFIKKTDEAARAAQENAKVRVRYVLEKMKETGRITDSQFHEATSSELMFSRGKIGYALDYVMEMVTDAVSTPDVLEALREQGIDNLATSGLRVITTVDERLQKQTLYSLRQELSRLDVILRGYPRDEVQKELQATDYVGDMVLKKDAFLFGTIKKITRSAEKANSSVRIEVDLGRRLGTGVIEEQGLMGLLAAQKKWKQGRWSDVTVKDLPLLLSELREGDRAWVCVKDISADGLVELELERFPKIQGGALILQDGLIRAMAGGVENRFFNRAIYAKRTMGSAFKPFVYTAALQLGWNATDLLSNKRDVFVYQRQPYFPRPDHKSENSQVSMSWAGVRSENLASVWLLYHLCDHLTAQQFQEIVTQVGLAPGGLSRGRESYAAYTARIRDRHGIVINRAVLERAAFDQAIANLETDFIFENRLQEYTAIKNMHYGLASARSLASAQLQGKGGATLEQHEVSLRKSLLAGQDYLNLVALQQKLVSYRHEIEDPWNFSDLFIARQNQGKALLYYDSLRNRYTFTQGRGSGALQAVNVNHLRDLLAQQDGAGQEKFWSDVFLESLLSSASMGMLRKQVDLEFRHLSSLPPYSVEVLSAVKDFRILVGLQYLVKFARELGIKSQLDPVLSFPLGSNVVTLLEFVRMYEGIVTGGVVMSEGQEEDSRDLLSIIDRIESAEGEILYQPKRKRIQLVAPETALVVGHILENTVKFGTGRYADKNVRLAEIDESSGEKFAGFDLAIPLLGKTGTANDYTNASFFGYLPGLASQGKGLVDRGGYAVGVYVGFDDNVEMRRSSNRITGSEGALPTWTDLVRILLKEKGYGQQLDPVEISFSGLILQRKPLGQLNLAVQADQGGTLPFRVREVDVKNRLIPSIMTFGQLDERGSFVPDRQFKPYWSNSVSSGDVAF